MKFDLRLRSIAIVLAMIGLADSVYLTIIKLTNEKGLCLQGIGDCWSVNTSRYSEIMGIPIAILGAGAYAALLILFYLETRNSFWQEYSPMIVFGITLAGLIFSIYLTYLEVAVIKAICPFCVLSAVVMAGLFVLSMMRLFKNNQAELNSF